MTIDIKLVSEEQELTGILDLHLLNLRKNITAAEAFSDGFVTAEYSLEFLKQMHNSSPSVIAKDGDKVVGYALVATHEVRYDHELMSDLFEVIDTKSYKGRILKNVDYVCVGQLCVSKDYRGQGLVKRMYDFYRDCYAAQYEFLITDVAQANPRSLKAHKKSGFEVIDTLVYGGIGWDIVLWDWRK